MPPPVRASRRDTPPGGAAELRTKPPDADTLHPRASIRWRSVGICSGSFFLSRVSPIPSVRCRPCSGQIRFLLSLVPRSGTQGASRLRKARSRPATPRPARSGRTPAEHSSDGVPPAEPAPGLKTVVPGTWSQGNHGDRGRQEFSFASGAAIAGGGNPGRTKPPDADTSHPRASIRWRSAGICSGSVFLSRVSPIPSVRCRPCSGQIRFLLSLVPRSGTQVAFRFRRLRSRPATPRPARSGRTPAERPSDGVPPAELASRAEDRRPGHLRHSLHRASGAVKGFRRTLGGGEHKPMIHREMQASAGHGPGPRKAVETGSRDRCPPHE
jgi:hypothetical protein